MIKILFLILYLTVYAHGATIVRPGLPEETPQWAFITEAKIEVGDVVLCRGSVSDDSPWFVTVVLLLDEDNSIMVMKPMGSGISLMVQVPMTRVLDIVRKHGGH